MLRVVVAAPPAVLVPGDLAALPASADLVELRLDRLRANPDELDAWIGASPRPVLATVRSKAEGGEFAGNAREAAVLLERAAAAGAAWIDVEASVAPHVTGLPADVRIVVSHHGPGPFRPPASIAGRRPHLVKRARHVGTREDLDSLLASVDPSADPAPTCLVPYGPLGALRAALSRHLLYGAAAPSTIVVAGQPTLSALLDELRAGEVSADAARFGLLGRPPAPSPSPAMHNAAFRHLSLDALYVPLPDVAPEEALALGFRGFSVTMPWKPEALRRADARSGTAEAAGAANTLVAGPGGSWRALNTDVDAIRAAVPPARPGETAHVQGAGGYARAAIVALAERGYDVRLGARRRDAGVALARASGAGWAGPSFQRRPTDAVLLNATPLGADGDVPAPLKLDGYEGLVVLDAPYGAPGTETGLVRAAAATARRVVDGRALLVLQARGQVEAFTGRRIPDRLLELALDPPAPLFLLGLRGAGKTTVGRLVARHLGRPFVDLDAEVERISGRGAAAWIDEAGVDAFREVEATALARLVDRRGIVIAGGGGALELQASADLVVRSFVPVWLHVDAELAARRVEHDAGSRPTLAGRSPVEEARILSSRRAPIWQRVARCTVDASREAEEVRSAVVEAWLD